MPPRVLLLWPGTEGAAAGNFGVPQLVGLATYVHHATGAEVRVVDLGLEVALGPVSLPELLAGPDGGGYDVIGLSCYSSYDWLKVQAIAELARRLQPDALLCAGGYHASARPHELLQAFDVVVVGEGERPLARIVDSVAAGAPLRGQILGPEPILDLDAELPPTDWSYLERYRPFARRLASQAEIYLSRGCPFDCAFCMEKAKREVSWRAFSVDRALDELRRLDAFLDLSGWTLYLADALFGMRSAWRKELLLRLARDPLRARQLWLLIRVDMVDDEDLRLFQEARCAPGFGLESGDERMLATARKAGKLRTYLDRMRHVATRARELDLPWGANVIVGHPGETEESMRTSAGFLRELFLDPRGTTGFLSIDPFRFYPGSPIDAELPHYEATYGARIHRPRWWDDGDQEFLSEWVDPSADLPYRRRVALEAELFAPIAQELPSHYVHDGPAADYFRRAVDHQVAAQSARDRLHFADRYYAWKKWLGQRRSAERELPTDVELAAVCRQARGPVVERVLSEVPSAYQARSALRSALLETPRERFVPLDEISASARDEAISQGGDDASTVSAFHAYARAFSLAGVGPGSRVLDLGAGTGYGTALLAQLVGSTGRVVGVEVDPALAERAARLLVGWPRASVHAGDARDPAAWARADLDGPARAWEPDCVIVGFALQALPASWAAHLRVGAVVVAPLAEPSRDAPPLDGRHGEQRLARLTRTEKGWEHEWLEAVQYVEARSAPESAPERSSPAPDPPSERARRVLPLVP